ncbi:glucosaminidase domain-containing protein [Mucilaginibacter sp. UR6-11]|uniref:glucosaminidase domain-containing protein n=1 Tax=Mucilaginibacter sp. UR6-11 TaxID=1435644 RepID=UPI001E3456E2|nr:glucosaminidase domain-containing protein [Mucilaginibacter sp. UR6-11]MCC8424549.1 glucosaminidase domain-containing protein [Mucilaginibacter sp. UR6-11]
MIYARPCAFVVKRNLCFLFTAAMLFASCTAHKKAVSHTSSVPVISNNEARRNNTIIQKERSEAIAAYVPFTVASYIERFKAIAVREMNLYGIPASITLAQGLFESGFGNGDLARIANNHFGIKCTSDWKGKSYYKDDDQVNDCFRVYDKPEDSFRDHSEFLKRKRYAPLFELDKNDYQGWANGLKQAGYATNPKYPQLLINVIEKYHLDAYDRPEGDLQKIKREDRVLAQINQNIGKAIKDSLVQNTPATKLYTIKTGDTLYNISKRFGLTVDELKALNNMADNSIKIGQTLVIAK